MWVHRHVESNESSAKTSIYKRFTNRSWSTFRPYDRDQSDLLRGVLGKPSAWRTGSIAEELGVTEEAVELFRRSEAIDLHLESFVWRRIFGYDLNRVHRGGLFGRSFFGHADFPTARQIGLAGATWVISTNPARSARGRRHAFEKNLGALQTLLEEAAGVRHVRSAAEFRAAHAAGDHAAFIGIQGGNALDDGIDALDLLADRSVLRVTLLHLTSSRLGATSAPGGKRSAGIDRLRQSVRRALERASRRCGSRPHQPSGLFRCS